MGDLGTPVTTDLSADVAGNLAGGDDVHPIIALNPIASYRPLPSLRTVTSGAIELLKNEVDPTNSNDDLIQPTEIQRPLLATVSGQPAIHCDGINDWLYSTTIDWTVGDGTSDWTQYVLCTHLGALGSNQSIVSLRQSGGAYARIRADTAGTGWQSQLSFGGALVALTAGAVPDGPRWQYQYQDASDSSTGHGSDCQGGSLATGAVFTNFAGTQDQFTIGARQSTGVQVFNGYVWWALVWDRLLSSGEHAVVQSELEAYVA